MGSKNSSMHWDPSGHEDTDHSPAFEFHAEVQIRCTDSAR
jgi:hypothetical protein